MLVGRSACSGIKRLFDLRGLRTGFTAGTHQEIALFFCVHKVTGRQIEQRDAFQSRRICRIDVERDVIGHMGFRPQISPALKLMEQAIFRPEPLQLAKHLAQQPRRALPAHLDGHSASMAAAQ